MEAVGGERQELVRVAIVPRLAGIAYFKVSLSLH